MGLHGLALVPLVITDNPTTCRELASEPGQEELDVVSVTSDRRHIFLGECKWTQDTSLPNLCRLTRELRHRASTPASTRNEGAIRGGDPMLRIVALFLALSALPAAVVRADEIPLSALAPEAATDEKPKRTIRNGSSSG